MNSSRLKICFLLILLGLIADTSFAQATFLHEDFSTCISNLPNGWQKYSVTGTDTWGCTSGGQTGKGVTMSGYSSGNNHDNEDWLISPQIDLSSYTNPSLSFWCRTKYSGAFIQVFVSANYSGSGNPNTATWTTLPVVLPTSNSDVWFLSDNINLQAYKTQPMYIAFKYISSNLFAATWKVDEVNVSDGTLNLSNKFINTGQCIAGASTSASTFNFTMNGSVSSFSVDVPSPFEISKDNISFGNQLNYTSSIANNTQTVYVRIYPTVNDKVYRNQISFTLNGNLLGDNVMLLGTSLPDDKTLRVYNWNMRWFGDPSSCNCDTNEARLNATRIMKDIKADMYCLEEVVNPNQIAAITSALGSNYQYIVSPFCSFATSTSSASYATGQKLAYIYNTDKIENLGTFGLLASTYPSDTSTNSGYYCFSSGRFPFIMKAKLKLNNGLSDTIIFSNIHAKAISDVTSYNRRTCGAVKMTDSLNALFPGKKMIVLGDYNDYLEGSVVSGMTASPYQYMLDHGFAGITLPSLYPNQTTFVGGTNTLFDNIACTPDLMALYPDSSCFIFSEVEKYITDYGTTTSDHIPVVSYFKFDFPNRIHDVTKKNSIFTINNPSSNTLQLLLNEIGNAPCILHVFDMAGHAVFAGETNAQSKETIVALPFLQDGIYFVELSNGIQRDVRKWMVRGQ